MRRNYFVWGGMLRRPWVLVDDGGPCHGHRVQLSTEYPTIVIDVDLASWALPMAIHAGGPLLSKPGFHVRIGPINIGWSKL